MEEPRKVLKAQYVGSTQVRRPSGMETLNDAIDQMVSQVPTDQWREVNVAVAPSVVTVTDAEVRVPKSFPSSSSLNDFCYRQKDEEKIIVESRVRFLSFLGIGRQVEHCGFIVHTANDVYIAHVLYCHPSSGAICKTIEAACKVTWTLSVVPVYRSIHFVSKLIDICRSPLLATLPEMPRRSRCPQRPNNQCRVYGPDTDGTQSWDVECHTQICLRIHHVGLEKNGQSQRRRRSVNDRIEKWKRNKSISIHRGLTGGNFM